VRNTFIGRSPGAEPDDPTPIPLAGLLRPPKASGLRLRLYLALLWFAGGGDERHSVTIPARAWAELLDLPEPEGRGDRSVRAAVDALERANLVRTRRETGRPTEIVLLREDGTGQPYTHPGEAAAAAKEEGEADPSEFYVQLPPGFWTQGWALTLSTPALALLLVLLVITRNGERKRRWISPEQARDRFGLSQDTWSRGVAELVRLGLLEVHKRPVSEDFGWRRVRNTYTLLTDRLEAKPGELKVEEPTPRAKTPKRKRSAHFQRKA
jgi:hypothetical protein